MHAAVPASTSEGHRLPAQPERERLCRRRGKGAAGRWVPPPGTLAGVLRVHPCQAARSKPPQLWPLPLLPLDPVDATGNKVQVCDAAHVGAGGWGQRIPKEPGGQRHQVLCHAGVGKPRHNGVCSHLPPGCLHSAGRARSRHAPQEFTRSSPPARVDTSTGGHRYWRHRGQRWMLSGKVRQRCDEICAIQGHFQSHT
jgi:hypothetical protein